MSTIVLEDLMNTTGGKVLLGKFQAEARAATDEHRKELSAQLTAIELRAQREAADLGPRITKAELRLTKAVAELESARNGLNGLTRIRDQQGQAAERQRQTIIRELEQTCPPEVHALIDELEKAINEMGRHQASEETRDTDKDHHLGGKIRAIFSNRPAIKTRTERLIRARQAAYALRSKYVADFSAEIAAICATLPADEFPPVVVVELED